MATDRETGGRWRRRSAARPGEIVDAAMAEFAQRGFAAARMSDIAGRAGLSKAALYVYFPTKADLFRAVLMRHVAPSLGDVAAAAAGPRPVALMLGAVLDRVRAVVERPELRRLARMVIAESGNFPELAALWHENVVGPAIAGIAARLAEAQRAGEVRPGDPRLMAFSLAGPLFLGVLWREVMEPVGGAPLDFAALAREHGTTLLEGLLAPRA